MSLLEVADVHAYYGENHILHGVSVSAAPGQVTAVVGRNGVGKTTLIRAICGFTRPRQGKVVLDGKQVESLPTHRIARLGIGTVPQGRRVFPSLTVREHLLVAARTRPGGWDLNAVVALFPRLGERMANTGNQLSGGEQQMLAVGRALMGNPRVLLMDEPSEGLAPLVVRELGETIKHLATTGIAIVLVEQNLPLVMQVATSAYILSKGAVVHYGPVEDLARDQDLRRRHLGV